MQATEGDRMVVAAARVDGPVRDGEITSTGPDGGPPYRVRWSDSDTESLYFPGPDAHVQHLDPRLAEMAPTSYPGHTKQWHIDVFLFEGDGATKAQVVLHGDAAAALTSRGQARRRPAEPDVPEIGDEVAVARALGRLSELLLRNAAADLAGVTGHPVVLRS